MSQETIDCAALGCGTELLPVSFDVCNPELKYGEIRKVYIANDGYPLTNWTDADEWAGRVSEDATAANAIRELTVIGTFTPERGDNQRISGGRFVYKPATYTLEFKIDDNNDTNYTFMRSTGCNKAYRAWFETSDGDLYGGVNGNEGILVVLNGQEPIGDDPEAFRFLEFVGQYTSSLAPLRIPSPIA